MFDPHAWIQQELSKVTRQNVAEMYLGHTKTQRVAPSEHRRILLLRIRAKFPDKFSGGSR